MSADAHLSRHPVDVVRFVCGAGIGLVASWLAWGHDVGVFEADLFRLPNHLTGVLLPPVYIVMQAGQFLSIPTTATIAWLTRRRRLSLDLVLVGVATWLAMQGFKLIVARGRPADLLAGVIVRGAPQTGLGFPSGHAAVAAALATVAGPWLPRRWRRATWVVVGIVGVSRLYVGAHLPYDVIAGAALGWMCGAIVLLARGAPCRRPDTAVVRGALASLGLDVASCAPLRPGTRRATPFTATTTDGRRLFVRALGAQQRDADLLSRSYRYVVRDDAEDAHPLADPGRLVDREVAATLLAADAGAHVPEVAGVVTTADGSGVLVEQFVDGVPAEGMPADVIDDRVLETMWAQLATLHRRRIAHRDARMATWLVQAGGPVTVTGLRHATTGADDRLLALDVAELLAATSAVTDAKRAVAAAQAALGPQAMADALPLLQPLALSVGTREAILADRGLERLRAVVADATGAAVPPPLPTIPATVDRRAVVGLVVPALAVFGLLPLVGGLDRTLSTFTGAGWYFVTAAVAAAGLRYVASTACLAAAAPIPLSLARAALAQVAGPAIAGLAPSRGRAPAVDARFVERSGATRTAAGSAVGVDRLAGLVVHLLLLATAAVLVGGEVVRGLRAPPGAVALAATAAVAVVTGVALRLPWGHPEVAGPAVRSWRDLRAVLREPGRSVALFGGSAALTATLVVCLFMSVRAFTPAVGVGAVALAYLLASAVGALAPTPGGLGVLEVALVVGLVVVGVPTAAAVAGTLLFSVLTFWLPLAPGAGATRCLQRAGVL